MPTDKTITRKEAGVFLPGDPVTSEFGWGVVVWTDDHKYALEWPHTDTAVLVKWADGSLSWREPKSIQWRNNFIS